MEATLNLEAQLAHYAKQIADTVLSEIRALIGREQLKEWYTTEELAEALGKAPYTIRENWCNTSRIEAEKDPNDGKWRIPGREYKRLVYDGGKPRSKAT